MELSYDYSKLIYMIKHEISELINPDDELQILRGEHLGNNYYPVVDYYYADEIMQEIYNENERLSEYPQMLKEKFRYEKLKSQLKTVKVEDFLNELKKVHSSKLYDYSKLIHMIESEIEDFIEDFIEPDEELQILRGDYLTNDYQVIIEYFYTDDVMQRLYAPSEEYKEYFDSVNEKARYERLKPTLEKIKACDLLAELEKIHKKL